MASASADGSSSSKAGVTLSGDFQTNNSTSSGNPVDRPSKAAVNFKSEHRDKIVEIVNNSTSSDQSSAAATSTDSTNSTAPAADTNTTTTA